MNETKGESGVNSTPLLDGFNALSKEQLLEIIAGYQREFALTAEIFDADMSIGGEPLHQTVKRKIDWLVGAINTMIDALQKAELDLSITPIEMTNAQYEDLTLRVADDVGDCAANIIRTAELAGLDLGTSNNAVRVK